MSISLDQSFIHFFEAAPVPVYLIDSSGKIHFSNQAFSTLIQCAPEMPLGHLNQLLPETSDIGIEIRRLFQHAGDSSTLELEIQCCLGARKTLGLTTSLLANQMQDNVLLVCCRDLTETVYLRNRLIKSENRFRELIQNSSLGLLEVDNIEIIKYANLSFCTLTGYTPKELIGRHAPSILLPGDDIQANERISEVQEKRKSGISDAYELRILAKGGEPKWVLISGAPLYDDDGNVVGSMGIHHDITFTKHAENELRKTLQKEADLNQLKTRFITLTSHEFRTPLTTIQTSAELMRMVTENPDRGSTEKLHRYIGRITQEVSRLTSLMNDILVLGRIEAGRIAMNARPIDLVRLTRELIDAGHFLQSDPRSLHLSVIGNPVPVEVDATLVTHIYQNLFSNALKYSQGKAEPLVTLEYLEDRCRISVRDYGIGIPEMDIRNLFQTFYRASNVENIQGTGLGLTIVKQFVELHGGKLFVESAENLGTCFAFEVYLKLPS